MAFFLLPAPNRPSSISPPRVPKRDNLFLRPTALTYQWYFLPNSLSWQILWHFFVKYRMVVGDRFPPSQSPSLQHAISISRSLGTNVPPFQSIKFVFPFLPPIGPRIPSLFPPLALSAPTNNVAASLITHPSEDSHTLSLFFPSGQQQAFLRIFPRLAISRPFLSASAACSDSHSVPSVRTVARVCFFAPLPSK